MTKSRYVIFLFVTDSESISEHNSQVVLSFEFSEGEASDSVAEISHRGCIKQRQEGTPGKQRVPLRRRGTEEVTSCKSRSGKIFTYYYPRSWHNVTFGKYARSSVGESEDEPQAGLALKRQSAKRGWNARLSFVWLHVTANAMSFYCRVSRISHTKPTLYILPFSRGSAGFHE